MIFFNDAMMILWLIGPMFYGFFVDVCRWVQLYFDGNGVFVSGDNEEISMLYLYIMVVKFTTMKFKVYTHLLPYTNEISFSQ